MAHLDTDLLKPTDVARRLGVSRSSVYDAAVTGRTPCVRVGGPDGPLRFLPQEVEAWLEQARRNWLSGQSAERVTRRAAHGWRLARLASVSAQMACTVGRTRISLSATRCGRLTAKTM